jgi:hypothetical protein
MTAKSSTRIAFFLLIKFFIAISQTFGRRGLSYQMSADCFGETEGGAYEEDC